ncbi:prepilin peptidase [Paenibacillus woosongensis]|uniref:Prepilin peptidase n=1 Tax=Paenibacillus woosongensis TaxID=307580 RepID=A0A7X2YY30_9BACL|nr:A24 family peptidase [Paenibacillus woosongensis]MUG44034.1 prepilin peptidase [Paenibacillus woosongensis]
MHVIEIWGCFLLLAAAFITDIRTMKIPNVITITGTVLGIAYHGISGGSAGFIFAIKGAAVGFGVVAILYAVRAVGGGDVKLFAGIGAWVGVPLTLSVLMYSILAAGCIGILILICRREAVRRLGGILRSILGVIMLRSISPIRSFTVQNKPLTFPFMLAVLPGAIMAVYYF